MNICKKAYDCREAKSNAHSQIKSNKKEKLVDELVKELHICHSIKRYPPNGEFSVLCKLAEVTASNSPEHLLAIAHLSSLLHKWPAAFTYKSDHLHLSEVANKLLLEVPASWELALVINFNYFLFHYENCLKKVWESRELFNNPNNDSIPLKWFPHGVSPPHRECLHTIVKLIDAASFEVVEFSDDIVQCLKVVIIFLGFLEEQRLQKKCLLKFETLLQHLLDRENKEATEFINLILLKCRRSQLFCDDGENDNAFEAAKEALEMVKDFENQFPKDKDDKLVQSRVRFAEIEAKACLSQAYFLIGQVSEAVSLIDDVTNNDFISADRVRGSRTSAFASSRFDLMLSHLCPSLPLPSAHPLNNALNAILNTCMRLELMRPGICQLLKCYDGSSTSNSPPSFGTNTKTSIGDMVFQFEHIEHLLNSLYRVSHLWLKSGNLRFALLYISDGIILTRALLLPEKELQFEALMCELALVEENSEKIGDEMKVIKDILRFIDDTEKKKVAKRMRLCSNLSSKSMDVDSDIEEALSNSSIMEETEDDPPINSVVLDVANVLPSFDDDVSSSPVLKRKNNKCKKSNNLFTHKITCGCRLCTNAFLKKQQCNLTRFYSTYLELEGCSNDVVECLEGARQSMRTCCERQTDSVGEESDQPSKQTYSAEADLELLAHLALTSYNNADVQSSKSYISLGLDLCEASTAIFNHRGLPLFYITAGQMLLPQPDQPNIDTSPYLDAIIDFSSKSPALPAPKPEDILASNIGRLKLLATESKILSDKVNIDLKSVGKTPKTKRKTSARTPMKSSRKAPRKPSVNQFTIFDDDCDVDIKLGGVVSDKFKTPARPTRSSQRVATRNVTVARKEARLRHRTEKGPVYTNEEIEDSRPVSRRKRVKDLKSKVFSESESEDIECPRASLCMDPVGIPLLNELDSPVFSPKPDSKNKFEKLNCEECLKKAHEIATASCDFLQLKTSACLLTLFYHAANDLSASSAYHILSIGTTLRITSHIDLNVCQKSMERAIRKDAAYIKAPSWKHHFKTVKDMVERTHPHHVISAVRDCEKFVDGICAKIPSQWTVCFLSTFHQGLRDVLLVTRLRQGQKPLHLELEGSMLEILKKKFNLFLSCNVDGMKTKEKTLWWTQRRNTNNLLDGFIRELEKQALAYHRGVLLGSPLEEKCRKELRRCVDEVLDVLTKAGGTRIPSCTDYAEIYMYVWKKLSADEKTAVILQLLLSANLRPNEKLVLRVATAFDIFRNHLRMHNCKRGHVVLILDKQLQCYPWESIPILHHHSVSRMPSVDTLLWQLELNKLTSHAKANLQQVSYVINPKGDLMNTESRFADWFSSIQSWRGAASRVPKKDEWLSYISDHDVFIFCGHGSGSSFMHREVIARRPTRACALLMGCSSGVLHEQGSTEPEGMVLAYLMSGSPCALACLWPVTDRDIDKYLAKCLSEWMIEGSLLTDIVRKAETVCKIPRLNGSACVVYGIPVQSCKSVDGWKESIPEHFKDIIS